MTDERNLPNDPAEDPALDRQLAGLPMLAPGATFMERVLRHVRIPYPLWFLRVRAWAKGWVTGPRGWGMLATLSVVTAATWGVALAVAVRTRTLSQAAIANLAGPIWTAASAATSAQLHAAWTWLLGALPATGMQLEVLVASYLGIAALSAVGLWRLARTPAHMRNVSHVVR